MILENEMLNLKVGIIGRLLTNSEPEFLGRLGVILRFACVQGG